jgi:hypothetical protein
MVLVGFASDISEFSVISVYFYWVGLTQIRQVLSLAVLTVLISHGSSWVVCSWFKLVLSSMAPRSFTLMALAGFTLPWFWWISLAWLVVISALMPGTWGHDWRVFSTYSSNGRHSSRIRYFAMGTRAFLLHLLT